MRGGQTLWVRLPRGDGGSFAQAAPRNRVAVLPGDDLDVSGGGEDRLRIHFRASPEELTEGVRRLAEAWRTYVPPKTGPTRSAALAV